MTDLIDSLLSPPRKTLPKFVIVILNTTILDGCPNRWIISSTFQTSLFSLSIYMTCYNGKDFHFEITNRSCIILSHFRIRCPQIRSFTLSDGEYYEMVKSNFERSDRMTVVRTTTNYTTNLVGLLTHYKDLLFNWNAGCLTSGKIQWK